MNCLFYIGLMAALPAWMQADLAHPAYESIQVDLEEQQSIRARESNNEEQQSSPARESNNEAVNVESEGDKIEIVEVDQDLAGVADHQQQQIDGKSALQGVVNVFGKGGK